tara:strand:- start:3898 stop:5094 length:1197 start_codon:yes stop_codon:yes gene_type:complete
VKTKLFTSINKFINWKKNFGDYSYDRMDYWSSSMGKFSKKVFYKNKLLGFPFAIWGLLLENFFPKIQKLYGNPSRQIIGDAHFASTYMELYEYTKESKYLLMAENILEYILSTSLKGYSGLCWGYTFSWQTESGLWKKNTPLITITPYAFWAFKKHYLLTNSQESKKNFLSIAEFALKDLKEKEMYNGTFCSSYSPIDKSITINASTYRAAILCEAYTFNKNNEYLISAKKYIEFVLSFQGNNGEWFYEAKGQSNNFIDNFHTCFVLRNLYLCYRVYNDEKILNAIKRGYNYYINNLFYKNGRPKHFSKAKYLKLRKYEMYDYAEGIKLGVLLKDEIPNAISKSIELANDLMDNFQTKKGYFITRVTSFGTYHKVPYLRWPQAQLLNSLTLLLKEIDG